MKNLLAALVLLVPSVAFAQRDLKDIPNPDPEVERRSFIVAPGFEVNLFAADPLLAKPIQMNFDAKGRLWVASSEVYPQIKPGQAATDKILILEDKDGDGIAESTKIFADGLLIPTGVEPGDGGAYVANSTEVIFLKDTDGDGKADTRRVMLSGFGTEDTHHIIHTFRWGEDGFLYFNQSIYIHSHIETPWGPRRLNGGGIWQFRPETMNLEIFARGWWNSWGHHQDSWGASFATDGAGGEGINYIVPRAYYAAAPDAVRILPGLNPGSPKYCGLEVVSGRHLPDDWQGNLLTNDFRANRVCRFIVSEDGSGFAAREQQEVIKTTHGAFRPIDVKMGPDGAIYIADWYNPIIQHGEVDFRDPRRDHTRGRIWRITAKNRPLVERPKLAEATTPALLDELKSPEGYTRHFAKRVLKERGAKDVIPQLAAWVKELDPKSAAFEHNRLEALWMYQSLDVAEPELLAAVLNSPNANARAAAARIVPHWQGRVSDSVALLALRVEDEHPRVRLEAVRALAKIDDSRSIEVAMKALDRPVDKWLDYALWLAARETQAKWLPAIQSGKLDFGGDAKKLTFALSAAGSPSVIAPLLDALRSGKIAGKDQDAPLSLVGALGGPAELGQLLDLTLANAEGRRVRLDALTVAALKRQVVPAGDPVRIAALLDGKDPTDRLAALRLAAAWNREEFAGRLVSLASAEDTSLEARTVAIEGLSRLKGVEPNRAILTLSAGQGPKAARGPAIVALAGRNPEAGGEAAVAFLKVPREADEVAPVVTGVIGRKGGSAALASSLKDVTIPIDSAKVAIRAARSTGRDESALIAAFTKSGGITTGPVTLSESEMKTMMAEVLSKGDPVRGEAVYRRKDLQCLNCHAIAGAGGQVGPGLESIGASAPVDYLIDSLLLPAKKVKEGYQAVTAATNDGRILTGIKLRENERELLLRDSEGREISIPTASIEEKKDAGSLMPVALTETLTQGEFLDLARFLSELGKVGPYSVSKARLVRRWQIQASNKAEYWAEWTPAYSRVDGLLPLETIFPAGDASPESAGVRFELEVTSPGPVQMRFNSLQGIPDIFIDGAKSERKPTIVVDLKPGRHVVMLSVAKKLRGEEPLRCEIEEVAGSAAKVQPVLGR
jgi:putative heme-binding domain-containing protein